MDGCGDQERLEMCLGRFPRGLCGGVLNRQSGDYMYVHVVSTFPSIGKS